MPLFAVLRASLKHPYQPPMLVTYQGLSVSSPFPNGKFLQLSHPAYDTLELLSFESGGYRRSRGNFLALQGRSALGRVIVDRAGFKPTLRWEISAQCTTLQLQLFNALLAQQTHDENPVTLADRVEEIEYNAALHNPVTWLSGSPTLNAIGQTVGYAAWNVLLQTDENYSEKLGGGWHLLQFSAIELL